MNGVFSKRFSVALLCLATLGMHGCVGAFFGFLAANEQRTGSHMEEAEYDDLQDKSFAVIVAADRAIQAEHEGLVLEITNRVSQMIASNTGVTHWVPPGRVVQFQYNNPSWTAMSYGEVAAEFEVDRLIVIDLQEYRLHDPGNKYLWDGLAAGSVAVIERESFDPDDFAFQKFVQVRFPDDTGFGPSNISELAVTSELVRRLSTRMAWLFYDKEVPNAIEF